jgi:NAD(P)-dependent dehydrogenase (short-subunit alcohol dehydrogenase family)
MKRVLVTGATGHIGSEVVSQLRGTGCRIRAMSRHPRSANLPADVEIVRGDLSAPDSLDACLNCIDSVFLVLMAPLAAAAPAILRIAAHARQIVLLTSPHRTPHPFFQQPNGVTLEELSRESARKQMIAMMFTPPAADMLLDAYQAAVDQPALVTSTVWDVTGAPARPFRDWAMDHASDFATLS